MPAQTIAYKTMCGLCQGRGYQFNKHTGEKETCISCTGTGKWEHAIGKCEECNTWTFIPSMYEREIAGELKEICWECAQKWEENLKK